MRTLTELNEALKQKEEQNLLILQAMQLEPEFFEFLENDQMKFSKTSFELENLIRTVFIKHNDIEKSKFDWQINPQHDWNDLKKLYQQSLTLIQQNPNSEIRIQTNNKLKLDEILTILNWPNQQQIFSHLEDSLDKLIRGNLHLTFTYIAPQYLPQLEEFITQGQLYDFYFEDYLKTKSSAKAGTAIQSTGRRATTLSRFLQEIYSQQMYFEQYQVFSRGIQELTRGWLSYYLKPFLSNFVNKETIVPGLLKLLVKTYDLNQNTYLNLHNNQVMPNYNQVLSLNPEVKLQWGILNNNMLALEAKLNKKGEEVAHMILQIGWKNCAPKRSFDYNFQIKSFNPNATG